MCKIKSNNNKIEEILAFKCRNKAKIDVFILFFILTVENEGKNFGWNR